MKATEQMKQGLVYQSQKVFADQADAMSDAELFDEILNMNDDTYSWHLDYAVTLLRERLGWE